RNYLIDKDIKEKLLNRAYERYKTEIHALHILIKCPADASPKDTLMAYNRAMNIRQRIKLGEPFESVAKGASDDPSVNINGGNLGYFTVFQTPLIFENTVYSMDPGELSMPVRTASGYHIIKVQDKRENQGKIKVAHIMKATPPGSTEEDRNRAKYEIDSLYNLLENGVEFSTVAKNNSDDIMSAQNGGELPWFSTGEMIHEFSVAAFRLLRNNEYTEPVKTVYGWHIIKRLDRVPSLSLDEARKDLESKLSNSYLFSVSRKSLADRLKNEYNYSLNSSALEWLYTIADSAFRHSNKYLITGYSPDEILYSFASEQCHVSDFANYISQNGSKVPNYDSIVFINTLLDQKVYNHLLEYENSILEEKYPDFGFLMNEFYDGILFFEISDSLIWKRSESDSTGLREYYDIIKDKFIEKPVIRARMYKIREDAGKRKSRKLLKAIKRYHDNENFLELIMPEAMSGKDTLVNITEGTWQTGENNLLDNIKWNTGLEQRHTDNGIILVDILEVKKERYKNFEDIKGIIISEYQDYLEEQWIRELRKKYEISVNRDNLEKLKSEIGR
ncbi:MAG TPA: hypothetical protein DEQ09_10620, partial [Bacteroidales bacterium]|nr:hypothetical protein [Bacteroidales bacterium]